MPALLRVETETWSLEVAGQVPTLPPFITLTPTSTVEVVGSASVSIFTYETKRLEHIVSGTPVEPVFFENTKYDFYLSSRSGDATLHLPPTAVSGHDVGNFSHSSIDFRNDIGVAEVRIESSSRTVVVRFDVYPRKIDYRTDYVHMRDEVASIARNLVMSVQGRTFGYAAPAPTQQQTLAEWLSLIRHYFKKLVATAKAIEQNPHFVLIEDVRVSPIERARRVDKHGLERLLRRRNPLSGLTTQPSKVPLPRRVPETTRYVTYDTPENQYVKAILRETHLNLQRVLHAETSGDEDADVTAEQKFFAAIQPEAKDMLREVQRLLRSAFLQGVQSVSAKRPSSLIFHRHPHYAALENIARLLNGGLSLDGGPLRIGAKDVALLYEYWCFLKLIELLRERFELEQQSIIRLRHLNVTVVLEKGKRAAVHFRDPTTGRKFAVIYNRHFTRLPTIAQRPDNVIQITSEDRLYIFDAKYRLAFDPDYQKNFGGVGPTVDDINTMHRYRDAIVIPHAVRQHEFQKGVVQGAFVLFPFQDEMGYAPHKFHRSIGQVQIGGLPFLPQATSLVAALLFHILQREGITAAHAEASIEGVV